MRRTLCVAAGLPWSWLSAAPLPSALANDAAEVTSAPVAPGGYGVPTRLKYRPTARRLRLRFWELPRLANSQVLKKGKAQAPDVLEALRAPESGVPRTAVKGCRCPRRPPSHPPVIPQPFTPGKTGFR